MLNTFDPWTTTLTWFVGVNWALTLLTSGALLFIYWRHRYLLVKPSVQLVYFSHLILQWPLTIYSGFYERWLPQPTGIAALIHSFCILGLAGGALFFRRAPETVWERLGASSDSNSSAARMRSSASAISITGLFGVSVLLATVYFFYVPFDCTGIYAIMVDPDNYFVAREISLKLLAEPAPRYAISLLMTAAAPLFTGVVAAGFINNRFRSLSSRVVVALLLLTVWFFASLNGGKANLVYLALVIVALSIWHHQLRISLLKLPLMIGLALVPALFLLTLTVLSPWKGHTRDLTTCFARVALTVSSPAEIIPPTNTPLVPPSAQIELSTRVLQELAQQDPPRRSDGFLRRVSIESEAILSVANLVTKYCSSVIWSQVGSIIYRAVVVPFEVGGWYVHYLQTTGPMGFGAIPRIAGLVGLEVVNPGNKIALTYGPGYYGHSVPLTMNAGAGFIFSMFAYFGYWALALNLVLLWLLDVAVVVYLRIERTLILPMLAASTPSVLKFVESDYGAAWLTHGFGIILILGIVLTIPMRIFRPKGTPQ